MIVLPFCSISLGITNLLDIFVQNTNQDAALHTMTDKKYADFSIEKDRRDLTTSW